MALLCAGEDAVTDSEYGLCLPLRSLAVLWWPLQLGLDELQQHPLRAPSSPVPQDITLYVEGSRKRLDTM